MKTNILFLIFILLCNCKSFSQGWGDAGSCLINVNDPHYQNIGRAGIISSTVKLSIDGSCTGTLINRNTSDEELGFYILTARHCITGLDFNAIHTLFFNYQSPTADNDATPLTNRGERNQQSGEILWAGTSSADTISNGYEYRHRSQLRLVADYTWGDLALIEVLTPLPPHFNVTYAGWNPSKFYNGISIQVGTSPILPSRYSTIHHPKGDIKKISGIDAILWLETPIASGCYTITTVIDVLFGWIWGHRVSTKSICNYVDNPWITVPIFQYGIVQKGSSGSGIFNIQNDLIGVLSGGFSSCGFPLVETYGKLHANYNKTPIKNALNPSNNLWVDQFGLDERKITSYENLVLPQTNGVTGHYFPANHYQANNKVVLQANNNITTNQPITIYSGADYEFVAGNRITLGPGFTAEAGSHFVARISPTKKNKSLSTTEQSILQRLSEIELPKTKKFEVEKYSEIIEQNFKINISEVYPNPNNGNFSIEIISENQQDKLNIEMVNFQGQTVYRVVQQVNKYELIQINKTDLPSGFYILRIYNNETYEYRKMIKN